MLQSRGIIFPNLHFRLNMGALLIHATIGDMIQVARQLLLRVFAQAVARA